MLTPSNSSDIQALLLDIEGTTTPIDFVFRTLFPYASEHVEDFLRQHFAEPGIRELIEELRHTWSGAASAGAPVWMESRLDEKLASAAAYIRWLIYRDSKITPLKTLQGKIWEQGYRDAALKGEVYPDVASAFTRWGAQGRRIAIFSSGSILAQKLLFAHSTKGDLSPHIEAYFDTTTGAKREAGSYTKIASALTLRPQQVLFVSDVIAELDAAHNAGMHTALSLRTGLAAPQVTTHPVTYSFDEIFAQAGPD